MLNDAIKKICIKIREISLGNKITLIIFTSFLVKLSLIFLLPSYYPLEPERLESDENTYFSAAKDFQKGNYMPYGFPGFPLLLFLIITFLGSNILLIRLFLALLSLFFNYLVFLISKKVFKNNSISLISLLIICFHPLFLIESVRIRTDTFAILLFTFCFYLFLEIYERLQMSELILRKTTLFLSFIGGLAYGSLVLVRTTYAPSAIFFFVYFLKSQTTVKNKLYLVMISFIGLLIVLVPWFHFAHSQTGEYLISNGAGTNFYKGNNPDANGYNFGEPLKNNVNATDHLEANDIAYELAFDFWKTDPIHGIYLFFKKMFLFLFIPQKPPWLLSSNSLSFPITYLHFFAMNAIFSVTTIIGINGMKLMQKEDHEFHTLFRNLLTLFFITVTIFVIADVYRFPFEFFMVLTSSFFIYKKKRIFTKYFDN